MIAAVTMVKNEEDVIGYTISHLFAEGVDLVIVADNGSTDGTRKILEGIAKDHNLMILDDPEVGYYQSAKMTHLANLAMDEGADWVIPFDADELWYSQHGRLSEVIPTCQVDLLEATVYDHRPDHTDDLDNPNPFTRMPYRLVDPLPLSKVAFKSNRDFIVAQGNHDVFELNGLSEELDTWQRTEPISPDRRDKRLLQLRHFPYRSYEQLARKVRQGARAYEESDLPLYQGEHWRVMGQETDEQLSARWEQMYEWERVCLPAPYKGTWSPDE